MSRAVHPREFSKVDVDHRHIPLWASHSIFHFFVASSLNLWGWRHVSSVTSWGNPVEDTGDWFHLHCQAGGQDRIGCTLLDSEAPPWLVFGNWAISVHYEVLRSAVFLNEKLDLSLCFACWPFSTCFPKSSGRSVSWRRRNQFGYLSHSLVCLSCVSWHTCSIDPSKTCPVPVCIPLCLSRLRGVSSRDFRRHWSMLWPASLSVWLLLASFSISWSQIHTPLKCAGEQEWRNVRGLAFKCRWDWTSMTETGGWESSKLQGKLAVKRGMASWLDLTCKHWPASASWSRWARRLLKLINGKQCASADVCCVIYKHTMLAFLGFVQVA